MYTAHIEIEVFNEIISTLEKDIPSHRNLILSEVRRFILASDSIHTYRGHMRINDRTFFEYDSAINMDTSSETNPTAGVCAEEILKGNHYRPKESAHHQNVYIVEKENDAQKIRKATGEIGISLPKIEKDWLIWMNPKSEILTEGENKSEGAEQFFKHIKSSQKSSYIVVSDRFILNKGSNIISLVSIIKDIIESEYTSKVSVIILTQSSDKIKYQSMYDQLVDETKKTNSLGNSDIYLSVATKGRLLHDRFMLTSHGFIHSGVGFGIYKTNSNKVPTEVSDTTLISYYPYGCEKHRSIGKKILKNILSHTVDIHNITQNNQNKNFGQVASFGSLPAWVAVANQALA
jgi:hypothetical protein